MHENTYFFQCMFWRPFRRRKNNPLSTTVRMLRTSSEQKLTHVSALLFNPSLRSVYLSIFAVYGFVLMDDPCIGPDDSLVDVSACGLQIRVLSPAHSSWNELASNMET